NNCIAEDSSSTRLVFDNDGLAQSDLQRFGKDAPDDIGATARSERDDHMDRLLRAFRWRGGVCRPRQTEYPAQRPHQSLHGTLPVNSSSLESRNRLLT